MGFFPLLSPLTVSADRGDAVGGGKSGAAPVARRASLPAGGCARGERRCGLATTLRAVFAELAREKSSAALPAALNRRSHVFSAKNPVSRQAVVAFA